MSNISEPLYCPVLRFFNADSTKKPQNKFPICEVLEMQPLYEPGDWLFEGDSELHYTNVKAWYGNRATNFSNGGSTTADVLARLALVQERNPKRICLSIAGNDILRLIAIDEVLGNLRQIIIEYLKITPNVYVNSIPWLSPSMKIPGTKKALKKLLVLIYSGIIPKTDFDEWVSHQIVFPVPGLQYNTLILAANIEIRKICLELGVSYVDTTTRMIYDYDNKFKLDGIHYNNKGRQIVSQEFKLEILKKEGHL
jgi:lysophospholipase L1-like esterase